MRSIRGEDSLGKVEPKLREIEIAMLAKEEGSIRGHSKTLFPPDNALATLTLVVFNSGSRQPCLHPTPEAFARAINRRRVYLLAHSSVRRLRHSENTGLLERLTHVENGLLS